MSATTDVRALAAVPDGELTPEQRERLATPIISTSPVLALARLVRHNQLTDTQRESLIELLMSVDAWLDACPAAVSSAYVKLTAALHEPGEPMPRYPSTNGQPGSRRSQSPQHPERAAVARSTTRARS